MKNLRDKNKAFIQLVRISSVAATLAVTPHAFGLITNDGVGTKILDGGDLTPSFGAGLPAGFNPDGIAVLELTPEAFGLQPGQGTGILLETGRHVLTAAHLWVQADRLVDGVDTVIMTWDVDAAVSPSGEITESAPGDGAAITFHDDFNRNAGLDGILGGYDIAIIELSTSVNPGVPRTKLTEARRPGGTNNDNVLVTGYGPGGIGNLGVNSILAVAERIDGGDPKRRVGANRTDFNVSNYVDGDGDPFYEDPTTAIAWDFDGGGAATNISGSSTGIGNNNDEVGLVQGDSGGPVLRFRNGEYEIIGVNSLLAGVDGRDIDPDRPGTWGEANFAANLAARNKDNPATTNIDESEYSAADWIRVEIGVSAAFGGPSGSSFGDPNNWIYGSGPSASTDAIIAMETTGTRVVVGPSSTQPVNSLLVGTGQGGKVLVLNQGGALTMPGDFVIDTNGLVDLSQGDVIADRLVIQATDLPPGPPTPVGGAFVWNNSAQPSSLAANEVIIRPNSAYFHRTTTGIVDVDHLAVEAQSDFLSGGVVALAADLAINQSVTNAWILDLAETDVVAGNTLTVGTAGVASSGTYMQTLTGELRVEIGGTATGQFDRVVVHGDVFLSGALFQGVATDSGYTPTLYDSFEIITADTGGTVNGTFDFLGVSTLNTEQTFAITYSSSAVMATVAIFGDANLDGRVSFFDFATLQNNFNQAGTWADGDYDQNGIVNFADFQLLEANFGFDLALGGFGALPAFQTEALAAFAATVPEPTTLLLLASGLGLLRRRPARVAA